MKKLSIILFSMLILAACKKEEEVKDYVTISGKVSNKQDSIIAINGQQYNKVIKVKDDGSFKDTLEIAENFYVFSNGAARTIIQLKNGYNLGVEFDAQDIAKTIHFSGLGAGTNNYMAEKMRLEQAHDLNNAKAFFELDKPAFEVKLNETKNAIDALINNAQGLDSAFASNEIESNKRFVEFLTSNYDAQHAVLAPIAKGKPSPKFRYPNVEGKYISLDDLKGKYVYIDVWATWCGPCKREIPFLKELEQEYHGKNITIVSLSIDKQENKGKWKAMVGDRGLSGIQIMADNEWESEFVRSYAITAIPRFLLIDPQGNIVSNDAPRPSDPGLKKLFNDLKI